jgi:hypothetical protein
MDAAITRVSIEVTVANERVSLVIIIGGLIYRQSNVPVMDFLRRLIAQEEAFGLWLEKNVSSSIRPEEVVITPKFPPNDKEYEYYTGVISDFFAGAIREYFHSDV